MSPEYSKPAIKETTTKKTPKKRQKTNKQQKKTQQNKQNQQKKTQNNPPATPLGVMVVPNCCYILLVFDKKYKIQVPETNC